MLSPSVGHKMTESFMAQITKEQKVYGELCVVVRTTGEETNFFCAPLVVLYVISIFFFIHTNKFTVYCLSSRLVEKRDPRNGHVKTITDTFRIHHQIGYLETGVLFADHGTAERR